MKKNKIIALSLSFVIGASILVGCSSKKDDPIVMKINSNEVTASEYAYSLNSAFLEINTQFGGMLTSGDVPMSAELFENIEKYAMVILQEKYAIETLLEELEVTATEEDNETLNEMIESTKESLGGIQNYKEALRVKGLTDEAFREESLNVLLLQDVIINTYGNGLKTEEELYKIYETEYMHAKHILIDTSEINKHTDDDEHDHPEGFVEDSLKEALKTAEMVMEKAKSGEDFNELMTTYNADKGQPEVGYAFQEGQMVIEFEDATKALEVNEISDVVSTQFGHHIIKKIEPNKESFEVHKFAIELGDGEKLVMEKITTITESQEVEELEIIETITFENYQDFLITEE